MSAYITPDVFTPAGYICGSLRIPNDPTFLAAVMGALADLTDPDSWQQGGTMTPDDAAKMALDMYDDFRSSRVDCSA